MENSNGNKQIRVRFAPSPTGPLHIGGVRTALYNYLFARKMDGKFLLRIEDSDQGRYVEGAEDYIKESLEWLGLRPDEGPGYGGEHGPYRQSERKDIYAQYAMQLVKDGHAYYAFDSAEDLEKMRKDQEAQGHHSAKYDARTRMMMKNSLTLTPEETNALLEKGENVTIRMRIPENERISFVDKVREEVSFDSNELDDKVILKYDGMPTYHLANIVDDHLMEISHVIRGEEWLSSTAHHVLLYRFFGWEAPQFTHLPLILKPTGKGKLSKRDGAKFGFPVFPLLWHGEEAFDGFRESGYHPKAILNFLVLLGWNPGNDEEIMTLNRMIELFSLDKIVKSGARFDIDKAKWFNQQYIISTDDAELFTAVLPFLDEEIRNGFEDDYLYRAISLMKERVSDFSDFNTEGRFLFECPSEYDDKQIKKRFNGDLIPHFDEMLNILRNTSWQVEALGTAIKGYLNEKELKMGVFLPLLRIMMCGSLKGPDLFEIIHLISLEETERRWIKGLDYFTALET